MSQLTRVLDAGEWDGLQNRVEIHRRSPVDMYIDEWVSDTLQAVERAKADLLAIDSLSDLRLASPDETRFEEYVYSLGQRCARNGTTVLMTLETRPPFAFAGTIGTALSHIADNIVLIGYQVDGSDVRRAIHVLKSRGSAHDQGIFEFTVAADGVHIGDPIKIDIGLPRLAEAGPGAR
jgi:circadian clock protein KaiC